MSTIQEIDKINRKLISILYRVLLILYSLFLLIYFPIKFDWIINMAILFLYIVVYILLYAKKKKWMSRLRLINDYFFIALVLYQIDDFTIQTCILLISPIFNSKNHSGDKGSFLVYFLPILIYMYLYDDFSLPVLVAFFPLFVINWFYSYRAKFTNFQQKLNFEIDKFFISVKSIKQPHKIYEKLLDSLNSSKILSHKVDRVICFVIEKNNYSIVNGSSYVLNFKIRDLPAFQNFLENKSQTIYNVPIEIEKQISNKNIIISCKVDSKRYCFVLFSNNNKGFETRLYYIFLSQILIPAFSRLSLILDSRNKQKRIELHNLNSLDQKITYVNNSISSMHFIRNKLGPLKSYLAMAEDFNKSSDPEKRDRISPHLKKEREKLRTSFQLILEKANYILKKANNPFNVYQTDVVHFIDLFTEVKRIWGYHFDEQVFDVQWEMPRKGSAHYVRFNNMGLVLVLANWINNMKKFHSGTFGVKFIETDKDYLITFYNSLSLTKKDSLKFISDFNDSERSEIVRRETHGLLEIKDFLMQMRIPAKLYELEGLVNFQLKFKRQYNEKSIDI